MSVEPGKPAPAFTMKTDGGGEVSLDGLRGKKVVLYFYPKDDTPGCTKEACGFRDSIADFDAANTVLIGVSPDGVASHDKFKAKYQLPFTLGSDAEHAVAEAYGSWVENSMYGRKYMGVDRSTFLIDETGQLKAVWRKVKVPGHVEEVLAAARDG